MRKTVFMIFPVDVFWCNNRFQYNHEDVLDEGTYWQLFDDDYPFRRGEARQTAADMGFKC